MTTEVDKPKIGLLERIKLAFKSLPSPPKKAALIQKRTAAAKLFARDIIDGRTE